jgi:hypothetical protein
MTDQASSDLSPLARRLVDELRRHTPFAEAIVRRQAERSGVSIASLSETDLIKIVPLIAAAATGFVDPDVIARFKTLFLPR